VARAALAPGRAFVAPSRPHGRLGHRGDGRSWPRRGCGNRLGPTAAWAIVAMAPVRGRAGGSDSVRGW